MNLEMNRDKIIKTVYEICRQKKVICTHKLSESTNSVYFQISLKPDENDNKVSFRISDHQTKFFKPHFKVLLVSKNTSYKLIERFVNKRIEALKHLSILSQLNMLNKKEVYGNARISR